MGSTKIFIIAVNLLLHINIKAEIFPSKCKLSDSDCLVKTANKFIPTFAVGIPSLSVTPIDPMYIDYIDATTGSLKFIMSKNHITGLKDTMIKSIKINQAKTTLSIVYLATCQVESQYEMSGSLLFIPIQGKGHLHCQLQGLEIHINLSLKEEVGDDGKTHWTVAHKNHKYYTKGKSDVEFENLFDGNEILAATVKGVIAQSGNVIVTEIGGPTVKAYTNRGQMMIQYAQNLNVPLKLVASVAQTAIIRLLHTMVPAQYKYFNFTQEHLSFANIVI